MRCLSLRQELNGSVVATDKSFFLCSRPTLYLTFDSDRVGDDQEVLRSNENDGPPGRGVPTIDAFVVLADATIQSATRRANVVAAVGTAEHVDMGARFFLHRSFALPPFETALRASSG